MTYDSIIDWNNCPPSLDKLFYWQHFNTKMITFAKSRFSHWIPIASASPQLSSPSQEDFLMWSEVLKMFQTCVLTWSNRLVDKLFNYDRKCRNNEKISKPHCTAWTPLPITNKKISKPHFHFHWPHFHFPLPHFPLTPLPHSFSSSSSTTCSALKHFHIRNTFIFKSLLGKPSSRLGPTSRFFAVAPPVGGEGSQRGGEAGGTFPPGNSLSSLFVLHYYHLNRIFAPRSNKR